MHFRRIVFILTLSAALAGLSQTRAAAQEFKKPLSRMELKDGDGIVFLGDSITHQRLYTQYLEDYCYTRFPGMRLRLHNAGVGGAKAWDALQRFDKDVAAYKPKYVTVLLGMNDGRYQPFDKPTFETYRKDMKSVIAAIKKAGATPILMTPTMFDSRASRLRKNPRRKRAEDMLQQYNAVLAYYGAWLQEVAVDNGYGFVDMFSRLNTFTTSARKRNAKFTVIPDSVHPGPDGQVVMAYSIIRDMLPRTGVSSILIARQSATKAAARAAGGKISGAKFSNDRIAFTFEAKHLPWVVPAEAQKAFKMLRLNQSVNREVLQVIGLPRTQYELSIDGEVVGTFTTAQLFRGLQLHNSSKTPQHKQAQKVAELNKQRNEGPVKSLRDEWRTFQRWSRLERQLEDQPDNAKLKQQAAALKKQLEGMDERIEKHRKAARALEDKIFEINKPKARKYVLKKVTVAQLDGTIRLDGKPLASAVVRFVGQNGATAVGKTDDNGRFTLRTGGVPGVIPGNYRVQISVETVDEVDEEEAIPAKYSSPAQSALRFTVQPGRNTASFNLKSR